MKSRIILDRKRIPGNCWDYKGVSVCSPLDIQLWLFLCLNCHELTGETRQLLDWSDSSQLWQQAGFWNASQSTRKSKPKWLQNVQALASPSCWCASSKIRPFWARPVTLELFQMLPIQKSAHFWKVLLQCYFILAQPQVLPDFNRNSNNWNLTFLSNIVCLFTFRSGSNVVFLFCAELGQCFKNRYHFGFLWSRSLVLLWYLKIFDRYQKTFLATLLLCQVLLITRLSNRYVVQQRRLSSISTSTASNWHGARCKNSLEAAVKSKKKV